MNRNSSNEELVREITALAARDRLEVKRIACSEASTHVVGISGDHNACQRLANKVKSDTGKNYQETVLKGSPLFYFPDIPECAPDGFRGGW
jgi:hypothetical protein